MRASRSALLRAVAGDRLGSIVVLVALLEVLVRLVLAIATDPIAAVVWPPIVAVIGLAWAVPTTRSAMGDDVADEGSGEIPDRLPSLVVVAIAGHALAVGVGTVLFLLVDTPIRYGLYWIGRSDLISASVIAIAPLVGVAVGTLVAWTIPALAVVRVVDGATGLDSLRSSLATVVTQPRTIGALAAGQLVAVLALQVSMGVASWIGDGIGAGWQHNFFEYLFVPLALVFEGDVSVLSIALGGLIAVFGTALWLAVALVLAVRVTAMTPARSRETTVPVARLALAAVLLTALVATAGAVRIGEVRPVDTSPESLPDDPDELYATALENTERSSYEYRATEPGAGTEHLLRIDRSDRRMVSVIDGGTPAYGSMGTTAPTRSAAPDVTLRTWEITGAGSTTVGAMPGYPYAADSTDRYAEPRPETSGWTVATDRGDELVLELAEPGDVFAAMTGSDLDRQFDDAQVHESRVQMAVDTDRKVLSHGEVRLNVTEADADESDVYETYFEYEYSVDVHVDRPAAFGEPSPSEWLWKLFAY